MSTFGEIWRWARCRLNMHSWEMACRKPWIVVCTDCGLLIMEGM